MATPSPEVDQSPREDAGGRLGRAAAAVGPRGACPPAMEDELSFSDIYGGRLALQRRYYSPSCREFCLSCPRLSLRSLTAVTCSVWLAAYGLFSLCEVMAGPSLPAGGVRTRCWKGLWGRGVEPGPLGGPSDSRRAGGRELAGSGGTPSPLLDSSLNSA